MSASGHKGKKTDSFHQGQAKKPEESCTHKALRKCSEVPADPEEVEQLKCKKDACLYDPDAALKAMLAKNAKIVIHEDPCGAYSTCDLSSHFQEPPGGVKKDEKLCAMDPERKKPKPLLARPYVPECSREESVYDPYEDHDDPKNPKPRKKKPKSS